METAGKPWEDHGKSPLNNDNNGDSLENRGKLVGNMGKSLNLWILKGKHEDLMENAAMELQWVIPSTTGLQPWLHPFTSLDLRFTLQEIYEEYVLGFRSTKT